MLPYAGEGTSRPQLVARYRHIVMVPNFVLDGKVVAVYGSQNQLIGFECRLNRFKLYDSTKSCG